MPDTPRSEPIRQGHPQEAPQQLVKDTPVAFPESNDPHTFYANSSDGAPAVIVNIAEAANYVFLVCPLSDPRRGTVQKGGRLYYSDDWFTDERIELRGPSKNVIFTARKPTHPQGVVVEQPRVQLEPGTYQIASTTRLPISVFIKRKD